MSDKSQPPTKTSVNDFERQAEEAQPGLVAEFIDFLKHSKKWWLTPILVVLLGIGIVLYIGTTSLAPFIYTMW